MEAKVSVVVPMPEPLVAELLAIRDRVQAEDGVYFHPDCHPKVITFTERALDIGRALLVAKMKGWTPNPNDVHSGFNLSDGVCVTMRFTS